MKKFFLGYMYISPGSNEGYERGLTALALFEQ